MKNIVLEHNTVGLFTIQVVIATGSIHETKGIRGISHLLEHMMFKNKHNMSTGDLLQRLDKVGGSFNAATNKDWTTYYIHAVAGEWSNCVDLMHTIVFDCDFIEKELHKERRVVIEELLQSNDDPSEAAYELAYKTLLAKDNPYRGSVIGKIKDLLAISIADLKAQYEKYYKAKSNLFVYVNCPVHIHSEVQSRVTKKFKSILANFEPMPPRWTGCIETKRLIKIEHRDNWSQNATCIMFPGLAFDDPVTTVLEYVWEVLVGGLNSLIMLEIREKRGYIYSMQSFTDSYRDGGVTGMVFTSSHKKTEEIVAVIFKILDQIQSRGLTEGMLAYTKASYINKMRYRFTNKDYKQERQVWNHFYGIDRTLRQELKAISRITNEDVVNVCKRVFNVKKSAIVSIGHYEDPTMTERAIAQTFVTSTGGNSG
jgi:predicted Zn-dependent peptidase